MAQATATLSTDPIECCCTMLVLGVLAVVASSSSLRQGMNIHPLAVGFGEGDGLGLGDGEGLLMFIIPGLGGEGSASSLGSETKGPSLSP